MTLELQFQDPETPSLETSFRSIDDALDESFLADLDAAFARAEADAGASPQILL